MVVSLRNDTFRNLAFGELTSMVSDKWDMWLPTIPWLPNAMIDIIHRLSVWADVSSTGSCPNFKKTLVSTCNLVLMEGLLAKTENETLSLLIPKHANMVLFHAFDLSSARYLSRAARLLLD